MDRKDGEQNDESASESEQERPCRYNYKETLLFAGFPCFETLAKNLISFYCWATEAKGEVLEKDELTDSDSPKKVTQQSVSRDRKERGMDL